MYSEGIESTETLSSLPVRASKVRKVALRSCNLLAEQPLVADCAVFFSTFEDVAGVGASER